MSLDNPFSRYADVIAGLPDNFAQEAPLPRRLLMAAEGRFEVYYAPFDHIERGARIVLVGICPGRVQAIIALETAREGLREGLAHDEVLARAKTAGSYAGPVRRHLAALLDHVGVARKLGIASTAELWTTHRELAHFGAALRYPVFEQGKNFSGSGIGRSPLLTSQSDHGFAAECRLFPSALFVPLGPAAVWACSRQVASGILRAEQVLLGLPHPSGANAERIAYFLGKKEAGQLSSRTRADVLDAGREDAMRRVAAWI
jgi:hypothetical protein